ncbi:MAG: hypothetical protein M3R38_02330 [Actinomycetota bacterium]|nr:hypothetical protein [Actinomycetota bacterium]
MQSTAKVAKVTMLTLVLLVTGALLLWNFNDLQPDSPQSGHHGSPAYYPVLGPNVSFLENSGRTGIPDSIITVCDRQLDGNTVWARAWNVEGQTYHYVSDRDGWGGECGTNHTLANHEFHQTGENGDWGARSYH